MKYARWRILVEDTFWGILLGCILFSGVVGAMEGLMYLWSWL